MPAAHTDAIRTRRWYAINYTPRHPRDTGRALITAHDDVHLVAVLPANGMGTIASGTQAWEIPAESHPIWHAWALHGGAAPAGGRPLHLTLA
jgi:hypothetical protein